MFNEIIATSMYTLIISLLFLKLPFIKYIVSSDHLMTAFFSFYLSLLRYLILLMLEHID